MKMKGMAFKGGRLGSALLAVLFFTVIYSVMVMALMQFAIHKRRETARMILYNAELNESEKALDRFISQLYFVGLNRPPQISSTSTNGFNGFVKLGLPGGGVGGYDVGMVLEAIRENERILIDDSVIAELPEVAEWSGYHITLDAYRVVAGAIATNESGMAYASLFNRPGVYVSRNVSFYQVPLLNYAIFYENTLELDAGQRIDIHGKVHTNDDWYLTTSSSAYYHDRATVAGNFYGGIYNPLDGKRRGWWSGSTDIHVTDSGPSTPGGAASSFEALKRGSGINQGYISSADYGGSPPTFFRFNPDGSVATPEDWWTPNPDWVDDSLEIFNGFLKDKSHGVTPVKLPIGEGSEPSVLIDPPKNYSGGDGQGDVDNPDVAAGKLSHKAAIIIETRNTGWVTGSGWSLDDASNVDDYLRAYRLEPDGNGGYNEVEFSLTYKRANDNNQTKPRTFVDHTRIYNGREEKYIDLVDIDMERLAEYLKANNPSGDGELEKFSLINDVNSEGDGIIYVNAKPNHVPSGRQPGVRIKSAADLSDVLSNSSIDPTHGMTLATNAPLYTKGDVNSSSDPDERIPLLLAGDSINILSNGFSDSEYGKDNLSGNGPNKTASATTTNAVFISGNVPTKFNQYGGGAENFFRYIEAWGGIKHTYRGSILNLFESRIATASWDKNTGEDVSSGYYSAPRRDWGWDPNFINANEPPGLPRTFEYRQGRWSLTSEEDYLNLGGDVLSKVAE